MSNQQGMMGKFISDIPVSLYTSKTNEQESLVIYTHSFSGNKLEGKHLLDHFFPENAFLIFDFMGCGNTEEDYVTLGMKEKDDLHKVIIEALKLKNYKNIVLWGRSMGGVTIIHYLYHIEKSNIDGKKAGDKILKYKHQKKTAKGQKLGDINKKIAEKEKILTALEELNYVDCKIRAVVLDSPFTSSSKVIRDLLKRENNIPHFITKMGLLPIKRTVKKKLGCDVVGNNKPKHLVKKLYKPALFIIGDKDELVNMKHFKKMFEDYAGKDKELKIMANTEHNDFREEEDTKYGVDFVKVRLERAKDIKHLSESYLKVSTTDYNRKDIYQPDTKDGNDRRIKIHQDELQFRKISDNTTTDPQKHTYSAKTSFNPKNDIEDLNIIKE